MLICVGFWLQVRGSQGSPWTLLETHFLTFGGLDWLWGLTLGGLHWLLGPRWPKDHPKRAPKTDFWAQHGPQTPSKRPSGTDFWMIFRSKWASTCPQLGPTWLQQGINLAHPCLFNLIQRCATLWCRILARNANMECQTQLPNTGGRRWFAKRTESCKIYKFPKNI